MKQGLRSVDAEHVTYYFTAGTIKVVNFFREVTLYRHKFAAQQGWRLGPLCPHHHNELARAGHHCSARHAGESAGREAGTAEATRVMRGEGVL